MIKCTYTGTFADSALCYKVGKQWFESKEFYINYLKSKDISYRDILEILVEDRDCIISSNAKDKIVEILLEDIKK
jgi:hypothetical protein